MHFPFSIWFNSIGYLWFRYRPYPNLACGSIYLCRKFCTFPFKLIRSKKNFYVQKSEKNITFICFLNFFLRPTLPKFNRGIMLLIINSWCMPTLCQKCHQFLIIKVIILTKLLPNTTDNSTNWTSVMIKYLQHLF